MSDPLSVASGYFAGAASAPSTLARRFPEQVRGTRPYELAPPLPVLHEISKPDHLLSAVQTILAEAPEDTRQLEAAVERDGHGDQIRVGLAPFGVAAKRVAVRD